MVKVTTTEGLELILENEFPCIINFKDKPEINIDIDSNGESNEYITSCVTAVLYLSKSKKLHNKFFPYDLGEIKEVKKVDSRIMNDTYLVKKLNTNHEFIISVENNYDINEMEEDVNYQLSAEGIEFYQYNIQYTDQ